MALSATDRLLGGYLAILTLVIATRGPVANGHAWLLAANALFALLLLLFHRLGPEARLGRWLHLFYPLALLAGFYAAIGVLNDGRGLPAILHHDATVQAWERALFGGQPSYDWIRQAPSVFWSGLLHAAYTAYYPLVLLPAPLIALRGDRTGAARIVFATMLAFVVCYLAFVFYPVAGPNYAFPAPTGPVREVWSARVVYGVLAGGSSVGAAFPSSHVGASFATLLGAWQVWRPMGWAMLVPFTLLTIAVVYCQMHYAVDALAGLAVGAAAGYGAARWARAPGAETAHA